MEDDIDDIGPVWVAKVQVRNRTRMPYQGFARVRQRAFFADDETLPVDTDSRPKR